jgi:flagellar motor switch protein FliM
MSEVLSSDEIEAILKAISTATDFNDAFKDTEKDFIRKDKRTKIKIYDFKRPDKFSRDQIRIVSLIHEFYARSCSIYLSELLNINVHVHVASVDQLNYEEFIRSIPTPTTLGAISFGESSNTDTIIKNGLLEVDPVISRELINRVTGGGTLDFKVVKELTDLEKTIIETPLVNLICLLREAWRKICDLRPILSQIETNPVYLQLVSPHEMVMLVTLEAKIGEVEGMINLCYPFPSLEPILKRLSSNYWYSYPSEKADKEIKIDDMNITLKCELFKVIKKYSELKNIKIGDIISFNYERHPSYCKLYADNRWLFDCTYFEPGELGPKYNRIKIEKIINKIEENYMNTKNNVISALSLNDVDIQISVELGRTQRSIKDVLTWGEGTIVELDRLAGEPADLFANNVLLARGEIVCVEDMYSIRITEIIDRDRDRDREKDV